MITEDYCSFQVYKLLKEKGFDERCDHAYTPNETLIDYTLYGFITDGEGFLFAPTHQMAMKWLREVHGLSVEPYSSSNSDKGVGFGFGICSMQTGLEVYGEGTFPVVPYNTYEAAVEAALKYSLENLI